MEIDKKISRSESCLNAIDNQPRFIFPRIATRLGSNEPARPGKAIRSFSDFGLNQTDKQYCETKRKGSSASENGIQKLPRLQVQRVSIDTPAELITPRESLDYGVISRKMSMTASERFLIFAPKKTTESKRIRVLLVSLVAFTVGLLAVALGVGLYYGVILKRNEHPPTQNASATVTPLITTQSLDVSSTTSLPGYNSTASNSFSIKATFTTLSETADRPTSTVSKLLTVLTTQNHT